MVRITIDEELKRQFAAADGFIELCDEAGELVVQVRVAHKPIPADFTPITPVPTEAELDELAKYDGPGMSTEELLKHLRSKK